MSCSSNGVTRGIGKRMAHRQPWSGVPVLRTGHRGRSACRLPVLSPVSLFAGVLGDEFAQVSVLEPRAPLKQNPSKAYFCLL